MGKVILKVALVVGTLGLLVSCEAEKAQQPTAAARPGRAAATATIRTPIPTATPRRRPTYDPAPQTGTYIR